MGDLFRALLDKINDFIFEVLGLILPASVLLVLAFQPILYSKVQAPFNLSNVYTDLGGWLTFYIIIGLYLFGHLIKIISIEYYTIMKLIFTKPNQLIKNITKKFPCFSKSSITNCMLNYIMNIILIPLKFLDNITDYSSVCYDNRFDNLKKQIEKEINKKTGIPFIEGKEEYEWYFIYKVSSTTSSKEHVKSLVPTFLAKYNSYRSLELTFLISFIYNLVIINYIPLGYINHTIYNFFIVMNVLMWYTFHSKYKRYWVLCGNEALLDLGYNFYFNKFKGGNIGEK